MKLKRQMNNILAFWVGCRIMRDICPDGYNINWKIINEQNSKGETK